MAKQAITPGQIKKIHTLTTALGIDDATYRAALGASFGVSTSKALNYEQAQDFINDLEAKAMAAGRWKKRPRRKKFQELRHRAGMATDAQLRMIEAIWFEVSRATDDEGRRKALRKFLFRIAKVSDLRFLDSDGAGKVINALKSMKCQQADDGQDER